MPRYRLFGLAVESAPVSGPDPVEALLAPFREDGAAGPPELVLSLAPRDGADLLAEAGEGTVLLRHADVVLRRRDAQTLAVESPRASLRVRADGARIEGSHVPLAGAGALDLLADLELFLALAAALHARGVFHLHAATLVAPSGAVIAVPGTGGCGKSTLATALVAAGHAYLGDDVVFLARRDGALRLLGFPRAFHLADRSARAVPAAAAHLAAEGRTSGGKRRLDPALAFPGAARREAGAPAALLFPEIAGGAASRLEPLASADALGQLLASSLFATTPLGSPAQRALLAEVVGAARAFRLVLGRDLLEEAAPTARRLSAAALAARSTAPPDVGYP